MEQKEEEQSQPSEAKTPSNSDSGSSDVGLDPKVGGLLAYLFGFVSGIILYLVSKDKYIRFHALQSTILSLAVTIVVGIFEAIPGIRIIASLISLAYAVVWIMMMVKAYSGEKYKLPVIGDIAEARA